MPVLISPTGVQAVHPDGEIAVARAAAGARHRDGAELVREQADRGGVAANARLFFQMYWLGSRDRIRQILDRARQAGAKGIILTLDWSFAHRRDWGSPAIPDKLDLKVMAKFAPQVLLKPRWLRDFARAGGP